MTRLVDRLRQNAYLIVLIVVVVALIGVNIVFYMGWQSAKSEQTDLEREQAIAQANLNVARSEYDLETLREQEAALIGGPSFPSASSVTPVQLSRFLASAADRYGVRIVTASPSGATGVAVEVTGSSSKMNTFLSYLENGPWETLKLDGLSFTPTGGKFTLTVATRP